MAFAVLATANAAGYRYGASDLAFHIPAVVRALDPSAFPRDAALIDAQGHLMLADDAMAWLIRATGLSLEATFFAAYLLSLALLWLGAVLVGKRAYTGPWLVVALGAALTIRHRIPRTSANSFEPYYSPRVVAFGLGILAIAAVQRRRPWLAIALVAVGAVVHVTTALWFAVLLGVAIVVLEPRFRRLAVPAALVAASFGGWALVAGPLQGSLTTMDDTWLQAVASKDSLFALEWPAWAWLANLGMLGVLWAALAYRRRRGDAGVEDTALAWGATALVAVFLLTLPLVAARMAFPTELQIPRVFWLVDLLATIHVVGLARTPQAQRTLGVAVLALAAVRGGYVMLIEHPERPLFAVRLETTPWQDAMAWLTTQPRDAHVLADPGHAWKYGTSVRVSAGRDVYLEEVKDAAVAIYSRDVAVRVVERTRAIGDFGALTADRARALAEHDRLDYLVTEAELPLPVAYRNSQFHVYRLSHGAR
jgi:hypothetical protein